MNKPFGIYIHIPFCIRKCNYCDFCSFGGTDFELRERYVERLIREIKMKPAPKRQVSSVFFGGGTPSLLTEKQMERIVSALHDRFDFDLHAEMTFEMNPATANRDKLKTFRSLGFNRVSIGCQSTSTTELAALGRVHSEKDFYIAFTESRDAGFENVNVDLMYGIPYQTRDSFSKTLSDILTLSPEHISAYGLIIEEGTPFYLQKDKLPLPGEDGEADLYRLAVDTLGEAGFRHYEISNYAKPGYECKHNLLYWEGGEYAAYGLSASSHMGNVRETNTRDINRYLDNPDNAAEEKVCLTDSDVEYEYIMLAMRLSKGISEMDFQSRFGCSFRDKYKAKLEPYFRAGYLETNGDLTFLNDGGLYISSALLTDILPD